MSLLLKRFCENYPVRKQCFGSDRLQIIISKIDVENRQWWLFLSCFGMNNDRAIHFRIFVSCILWKHKQRHEKEHISEIKMITWQLLTSPDKTTLRYRSQLFRETQTRKFAPKRVGPQIQEVDWNMTAVSGDLNYNFWSLLSQMTQMKVLIMMNKSTFVAMMTSPVYAIAFFMN